MKTSHFQRQAVQGARRSTGSHVPALITLAFGVGCALFVYGVHSLFLAVICIRAGVCG